MDEQETTPSGPAADASPPDHSDASPPGHSDAPQADVGQPFPDEDTGDIVAARVPEFSPLADDAPREEVYGIDRFYDVQVPVWAELGRLEMPLGELMKLGEGAVVRLGRPVTDPVDLVAQGVCLARGEVVVVDDNFAIRIKEIQSAKK